MCDKLKDIILKANSIHNNKYDYSNIKLYTKMIDKYTIICPIHGEYIQTLHKHLQGDGCKDCALLYRANIMKEKAKNEFIEKSIEKHGNKYEYSKSIYTKAIEPITITCKLHGDFITTPNKHLGGVGCKKCGFDSISKALIYHLDKFLDEVNIEHNNKYDYSKVIWEGIDKNIKVICPRHGEFTIRALEHRTRGCSKCYKEDNPSKKLLSKDIFIERHKDVYGNNIYDYSITIYKGYNNKVNVFCKKHGEFYFFPSNMSGCKKCMLKAYSNTEDLALSNYNKQLNNKCKNEFINKANIVYNNLYIYDKVDYIRASDKVIIICRKHGEFLCSPNNHLRGKGCRTCTNTYSKSSIRWLTYRSIIDKCNIQHILNGKEYNIPSTNYKADGYCKETNTIYEFHGTIFHGDPRYTDHTKNNYLGKNYGDLYNRTLRKEQTIKSLGYNLITIWEKDWDKIKKSILFIQRTFRRTHKKRIIIKFIED